MYYTDSSHNIPLINMLPKLMLKALKPYTYLYCCEMGDRCYFPYMKKIKRNKIMSLLKNGAHEKPYMCVFIKFYHCDSNSADNSLRIEYLQYEDLMYCIRILLHVVT